MSGKKYVIIGAGALGIYTALKLCEKNQGPSTVVIGSYLPGDTQQEYVSTIAAAHWTSRAALHEEGDVEDVLRRQKVSYLGLADLYKRFGSESGIAPLSEVELWEEGPPENITQLLTSLKSFVPDLEIINDKQFLEAHGAKYGQRYTGYNVNPLVYLPFMRQYLGSQGVTFLRKTLKSVTEPFTDSSVQMVFNCAGLNAQNLEGVNDPAENYPARGQLVHVKAPHVTENIGFVPKSGPPSMILPRPRSGGLVLLGGYKEANRWDLKADSEQTEAIIQRCTKLWPDLLRNGPLGVVSVRVGLRPYRKGGPRIEKESYNGKSIVHCYGAGSVGYQTGLGLVVEAMDLAFPSAAKL